MSKTAAFLAGLILVGATCALTIPDSLSGPAQVIDGDTIRINGQRIRIWGIDAPEHDQPCGQQATTIMRYLTNGQNVSCTMSKDKDRYGRLVAQCFTERGDLGRAMVAAGLAIDYTRYSGGYYANVKVESATHCEFSSPAAWRAQHRH